MLANTRHPDFPHVQRAFLQPQPGPVPELLICKALGYPLPQGQATIYYADATQAAEAGVEEIDALEYRCPAEGGYLQIMQHFVRYRSVWELLGRDLRLEASEHPLFAQHVRLRARGGQ